MKLFKNLFIALVAVLALAALQSCDSDPAEITIISSDLAFTATNTSIESSQPVTATSGSSTVNITISVTIKDEEGVPQTYTVSHITKNELPVMAGNIIEIKFAPTCEEQTEATFTMPDGAILKATATNPVLKWVVPDNVTDGMEIKGFSKYTRDNTTYQDSGTIKLIVIK